MKIELKDSQVVQYEKEVHYKVTINGKEVWISKYEENNEFNTESETDIFQGKDLLMEDEQEEVIDFINNLES